MRCIIHFLSDMHQKELRRLAQVQSESYEEFLEKYKDLFVVNFLDVKEMCSDIKKHDSSLCENCNEFKKVIDEIDVKEIEQFFDELKKIYIYWIDAKLKDSLDEFNKLLEKYDILNIEAEDIEKDIFFKGRIEKNILTKWDMFHIPFNKRYLIKNQRYSLTGQPIIYLGKSVLDVIEELEIEEVDNLKVSSVQINERIKVYDLRNDILNDINKKQVSELLGKSDSRIYEKRKFFKNILASVCSFEKRREHRGFSFCEEYVIPQILAQTLKNENYDGIIYYSTKRFKTMSFNTNTENGGIEIDRFKKTKFKENLALFTNFNSEHVYDYELYNKLKISVPIDISKVENLKLSDLNSTCKKITNTGINTVIAKSDILVSIFRREFDCIKINGEKYCETYIGKLHIYHIYCILNQILCNAIKG